jgi:primosomal protein N' (replication factor Y)
VLLPEIALTADFLTRVEARFGARPAEWHSGVTMTERRRLWKMAGEGEAQLVVGARSALFLPFRDLGLIVVDEEHDTSYKQEDGVLYNARDMAVLRAAITGCPVVLASATPSWKPGPMPRPASTPAGPGRALRRGGMPEMRAIDMRAESAGGGPLDFGHAGAGRGADGAGRTGAAVPEPPRLCAGDAVPGLRASGRLRPLRRADGGAPVPQAAGLPPMRRDEAGAHGLPVLRGRGADGGRRAGGGAAGGGGGGALSEARLAVLSSDLFGSARALKEQIAAIAEGGADIIIGTQIVAKGHNFPLLTLVGVIDADLGLQGSDLRAAERTFQLMRQVAGRAGRAAAGARPGCRPTSPNIR